MPIPLGILAVAGAGGGPALTNDFDLLETTILGSDAASVTFSSLGSYSQYKHLQVRIVSRTSQSVSSNLPIRVRFNSDTGSNYAYHELQGNGSAVNSFNATSQAQMEFSDCVPGATSTTSAFGVFVADIFDFLSTNKTKVLRALYGAHTAGESDIQLGSGLWNNTAALSSITFLAQNTHNFVANSRFSLYGIK